MGQPATSPARTDPSADVLRRAAEAVRNLQKQGTGQTEWADWVPQMLDRMASALEQSE